MVEAAGSRRLFSYEDMEGEYTSYTMILDYAFPAGNQLESPMVDNQGNMNFMDVWTWRHHYLTRAGVVTTFNSYLDEFNPWNVFRVRYRPDSIGYKYIVCWNFVANSTFHVLRRGVAIFTRNAALDHVGLNNIPNWAISPNGRYIVLVYNDGVSSQRKILLYEGRP